MKLIILRDFNATMAGLGNIERNDPNGKMVRGWRNSTDEPKGDL